MVTPAGAKVTNPMFEDDDAGADGDGDGTEIGAMGESETITVDVANLRGGSESAETKSGPAQWMTDTMDGASWTALIIFATFWVLLMPDIIQALLPHEMDAPLACVTMFFFFLFFFEIILNFWLERDYGANEGIQKVTVFFFVDVLGTVTLIPDFIFLFGVNLPVIRSAMLARAARAARMGARMSRFIRLFRMAEEPELDADGKPLIISSSNVGARTSDMIATRIVILVIMFIIVLPVTGYSPKPTQKLLAIEMFDTLYSGVTGDESHHMKSYMQWYNTCGYDRCMRDQELVMLKNSSSSNYVDLRKINAVEYEVYRDREFIEVVHADYVATYQIKPQLIQQSIMSIAFMLISVLILAIGAGYFQSDIHECVIGPIETMTALTRNLKETLSFLSHDSANAANSDTNEVLVLEQQIAKMLELLQVGFGEAGTSIIAANLSDGGELNAMKPGEMLDQLYVGFIMLENFGVVTQVMEEDVMLYANYVGEVVHNAVVEFGGSPNKNMGGAILCVWKGPDGASNGMKSFQKAINTVNESPNLRKLVERYADELTAAGLPDYKVELAAGLHCGWAIEGTVGSELKLDATYLSPNVNLAARIETATQQFGVHLMMSDQYYQDLEPELQKSCRKLDVVLVKGSKTPLTLWSPSKGEPDEVGQESNWNRLNQYTADYCDAIDKYIAGEWSEVCLIPSNPRSHCSTS